MLWRVRIMNEELFNEATKSNVLTKKLIDQLLESMTYSSISFINWTIETLSLIKARLQRGDRITDEVSGEVYTLYSFQQFVEKNFSTYIASQVFKETSKPEKIYFSLKPCEEGYSLVASDSDSNKTYSWISSLSKRFSLVEMIATGIVYVKDTRFMLMMLKKSHGCSGMTWKLQRIWFPKDIKTLLIVSIQNTKGNTM